ncbi:hypothetical protein OY671_008156, partial [Metschnikowia pulcherrima]
SDDARMRNADIFWGNLGIECRHGGNEAYYIPSEDRVQMPPFAQFREPAAYYGTLFHEGSHATGAASRCDRDSSGRFGSDRYAAEEAIADSGAALVMADLGIAHHPRPDHAAYIASWLRVLKADARAISRWRAKRRRQSTGCIRSSPNNSAWSHDGTCGGCLRHSPQERREPILCASGAVQQRQVLAGEFAPLLGVTPGIGPEVRQLGLERGDARCQVACGRAWSCRSFDLVEDVPMARIERIATASRFARDRSRRDLHHASRMVGVAPFAAHQPRQRRPVAPCRGLPASPSIILAHRHLRFA